VSSAIDEPDDESTDADSHPGDEEDRAHHPAPVSSARGSST
jgi:hypothetical protein